MSNFKKLKERLNDLEEENNRLKQFASEIKRRIRNVGRSQSIAISDIDELIVEYNIQY